jgi:hypothetical protein
VEKQTLLSTGGLRHPVHQNPGDTAMPRERIKGTLHNVCFLFQIYSVSVFCFLALYECDEFYCDLFPHPEYPF